MKPDLILIANATHARLLQHERGSPMVVLKSFEHASGRDKVSDLADDRAGHGSTDHGFGGAAYPPRVDAKRKEHARFAAELADELEQRARDGGFHALIIFASSPFLGELKPQLGPATARLLSSAHDLDLTSFGLSQLEERIARELV